VRDQELVKWLRDEAATERRYLDRAGSLRLAASRIEALGTIAQAVETMRDIYHHNVCEPRLLRGELCGCGLSCCVWHL
jgi:hypothetical protein